MLIISPNGLLLPSTLPQGCGIIRFWLCPSKGIGKNNVKTAKTAAKILFCDLQLKWQCILLVVWKVWSKYTPFLYISYYTMKNAHCTTQVYSTCCTFITSHWIILTSYQRFYQFVFVSASVKCNIFKGFRATVPSQGAIKKPIKCSLLLSLKQFRISKYNVIINRPGLAGAVL